MKKIIKSQQKFQNVLRQKLRQSGDQFSLPDTPLYPLAFHVPMPDGVGFDNGQVSFGFSNFKLNGLDQVELTQDQEDGICFRFPALQLRGNYDLQAKYMPKAEFDFGGNLMPLNETNVQAAGADASAPTYPAPTQEEADSWTETARNQKPKLQETKHGPTLLNTYNQHNESYHDVFILNPGLRKEWNRGGVTAQMSRDTHDAINNETAVNDKKYVSEGKEYSYNQVSIFRQIALASACYYTAETIFQDQPQRANDMYEAGAASLNFKKTLEKNLGQDIDTMNPGAIYDALNNNDLKEGPTVTGTEFKENMKKESEDSENDGGKSATLEAREKGWPILNEEERALIRKYMYDFRIEDAMTRQEVPQTLWNGACHAILNQTEAVVSFHDNTPDQVWKVSEIKVRLPAFAFDMDDSQWQGEAADIIRESLTQIHFVKSLLQKKLEAGISEILEQAVNDALTA